MNQATAIAPVNIDLPETALLDGGTVFVTLRTLDALEAYWREHSDRFAFACEGSNWHDNAFLHGYEWVFGSSKADVVSTVLRWGTSGIDCGFKDGCWQFTNVPRRFSPADFVQWAPELSDPHMPHEKAARLLQEQMFDEWRQGDLSEITFYDRAEVAELIAYWRSEQAAGESYYGQEHEDKAAAPSRKVLP